MYSQVSKGFEYDALSRLTRIDGGLGTSSDYTYDDVGQLLTLVHKIGTSTIADFTYTYDDAGNRDSMTDRFGLHGYGYDALYQVTSATHPSASGLMSESFAYDAVGNRTSSHLSSSHVHNSANRLLEDDAYTYTYDANGNLATKTDKLTSAVTTYTYDVENQLIRIDFSDGTYAEYAYDGLGRRIQKDLNGSITQYVYDQEDILLQFTGGTCLTQSYLHGPGIDQPLAFMRDTNADCNPYNDGAGNRDQAVELFADGLGSIVALSAGSTSSILREQYTYDAFGNAILMGAGADGIGGNADDVAITSSEYGHPYAYTGRELDSESGLYYYRARYYDPNSGRFLQEDPVFHTNLFDYTENRPLVFSDPYGLDVIVLNDSDAVRLLGGPYGHNAIAIGNDATGWTYYSQDGLKVGGNQSSYSSAAELVRSQRGRYDRFFRISSSPKEDFLMRETASRNLNNPYNANPLSKSRYHCGDLVNDTLETVGIKSEERLPYAPNTSFNNIRLLYPAGKR